MVIRLVTVSPCHGFDHGCTCPACKSNSTRLAARRAHCSACDGDPQRCLAGQGPDHDFEALQGCMAFTSVGKIRTGPSKAKKIKQPWEPRKAA